MTPSQRVLLGDIITALFILAAGIGAGCVLAGAVIRTWWPDAGLVVWQIGGVSGLLCLLLLAGTGLLDIVDRRKARR